MYTFDIVVKDSAGATVAVDTSAEYGYWERTDGSEGGGLWFDGRELVDYDGSFALPIRVINALRDAGFTVDSIFEE